jgi:dehydrogenase/reductase SDR family protein 7B
MQVAWITGASSGIGEELCYQLDKKGYQLVLSARNENELQRVNSKLTDPSKHFILPMDLGDLQDVDQLVQQVMKRFGAIHYVFHCGGISQRATAAESSIEIDRKIMEVNYFGTVILTKAVLPIMQRQGFGHFVPVSSIAGKFGFYLRSAYSASKHALHGFFESLALEEASNNIHVTIVCPGKINTPISLRAINKDGDAHGVMDHNQATGMPVDVCVRQLLEAVAARKREVLIGNKEIKAVTLKRFLPGLFWKVIAKQSAT